jgi:hypothetical protein
MNPDQGFPSKRQRIAAWLERERERHIVEAVTRRLAPRERVVSFDEYMKLMSVNHAALAARMKQMLIDNGMPLDYQVTVRTLV